jgi:hypothetical protein
MRIVAALFIDNIDLQSVPGPSTRIDITGIQFSAPAPAPVPVTIGPHLVVLVWNPPGGKEMGALEVVFTAGSSPDEEPQGEPLARNVQMVTIEPGKFSYQLVRPELQFEEYGTILARCRIGDGPTHLVPYTLLPPVA